MRIAGAHPKKLCAFICLHACLILASVPAGACTIFVLAEGHQVLFCNNEDWKDPHTRIWFVPGGKSRHGCAYVGFRNQWAQGGLNNKGLAFDWTAGITLEGADATPLPLQPKMKRVRGNPAERMLESCGSIEEAIAFYGSHKEPGFAHATMLVADRSGSFAVFGAKGGRLHVLKGKGCAIWGWQGAKAAKLVSLNSSPVVTNAAKILDGARSEGDYGTKYSNIFDLRTCEISLFEFSKASTATTLDLAEELGKGRHFYNMPQIQRQLTQNPRRLSRFREWAKNVICWLHLNG